MKAPPMNPTATESDTLLIARWCWPEAYAPGARESAHAKKDRAVGRNVDRDWPLVRAAELVLIERGLAEEYGCALAFLAPGATEIPEARGRACLYVSYAHVAAFTTAPLDARVRAMAAVVMALAPQERPR